MASVIPQVIDALYAQASAALTDRLVVDGYGVTDAANPNLLMVGVDDPDNQASAQSSDAEQEMATAGTPRSRTQRGTVTCAALSWTGGTDQKAVRDAVYATVSAVESLLRTDPTLGIAAPGRMTCQMGAERLSQNQYEDGVDALVIFNVNFEARI